MKPSRSARARVCSTVTGSWAVATAFSPQNTTNRAARSSRWPRSQAASPRCSDRRSSRLPAKAKPGSAQWESELIGRLVLARSGEGSCVGKLIGQCADQPIAFGRVVGHRRHGTPHRPGPCGIILTARDRSEEHTSELQSRENLVCRLLLEKKEHADTR